MQEQKIYVGLSGGVDSAVTLALLNPPHGEVSRFSRAEGAESPNLITAIFMRNWSRDLPGFQCPWKEDWHDAQSVALSLNAKIELWDFEKDYKNKVVNYLLEEYKAGRTPNPDIICNQEIKFKVFLDQALENGADKIATGHYARIHQDKKGRFWLQMARDETKDQSYFLARISQEALSKSLFPLGNLTKTEVRAIATKLNLPVANKKDSVGICFVGEIGITDFLKNFLELKPGPILDINTKQELGQHQGSELYTIGQRHGLKLNKPSPEGEGRVRGLSKSDLPYYVIKKDTQKNIVYVSSNPAEQQALTKSLSLSGLHLPTIQPEELQNYTNLSLRTRHLGQLEPIQALKLNKNGILTIELKEEIKKPAAGQSGVIYTDQGLVLATGFIQ
jgi:tRNA-specific 2-thiouridylase